jgi:hypothetical protein
MLTRRALLESLFKTSAAMACSANAHRLDGAVPMIKLKRADGSSVRVPENFTGLGYEMSSVAPIGLLNESNHRYVELIKGLGPRGVIRVGGIVADYTRYEPNGIISAERQNTVITRASLDQFGEFLGKIGWSTIWSVNFAQGKMQDAVDEASAVASVLGSRLLALEIGNEVENYSRGQKPFRKSPYDYEIYRKEYDEWRAAILRAVPGMPFAAPDTASSVEWVERMAADAKGDVQVLTTHYYRNGQTRGNAEQLLSPDPRLKDVLTRLRSASERSGIPWRMCETNSFSGGGRPGVSDTFIGALWTLDFMLLLAQYGCSGVNIETGVNQLGFISYYSPIQDDGKGVNTAGVPYYGMLAFAQAMTGCYEVLPIEFDSRGVSVTAYVLGQKGKPRSVVVVNRDKQNIEVSIAELRLGNVSALRLSASSPDSKTDVTLGGASVDEDGRWTAKSQERIGNGIVIVPKMSAVVLRN